MKNGVGLSFLLMIGLLTVSVPVVAHTGTRHTAMRNNLL